MNPLRMAVTYPSRIDPFSAYLAQMIRWLGGVLWGSLVVGAGLLAYRRLAGALIHPLATPWLAVVGLGCGCMGLLAVLALSQRKTTFFTLSQDSRGEPTGPEGPGSKDQVPEQTPWKKSRGGAWFVWSAKLSILLIAGCLTLPGTPLVGLLTLWGTVALGLVAEPWVRNRWESSPSSGQRAGLFPRKSSPLSDSLPCPICPPDLKNLDLEDWPNNLLEHMVRTRSAEGEEVRSGWVRVEFLPLQRIAVVHIGFCPPFAHTPRVNVRQMSGPSVRLKTTHLYPYGVRVELKREAPIEHSAWVLLQFTAQSPPSSEGTGPEITSSSTSLSH